MPGVGSFIGLSRTDGAQGGIFNLRQERSLIIQNKWPLVTQEVFLYNAGNEFTSVTGGFTTNFTTCNLPSYYSGGYSAGSKTASYMEVNISGSGRRMQSLVATTLINLTPYKTIYAEVEMLSDTSQHSGLRVGFAGSLSNGDNIVAQATFNGTTAKTTISADITSVTASGYPMILGTTDPGGTLMNFRVYKFWLV